MVLPHCGLIGVSGCVPFFPAESGKNRRILRVARDAVQSTAASVVTAGNAPTAQGWNVPSQLAADRYGPDYLTCPTQLVTYQFQTPSAINGAYMVLMWWPTVATAADSVSVTVSAGTGLLGTISVDQTADRGQWNILGTYVFSNAVVKVTVTSQGGGKITCADAVRFVPATHYLYDIAGRVLQVRQGTDRTQYQYDGLGRIANVLRPDTTRESDVHCKPSSRRSFLTKRAAAFCVSSGLSMCHLT